MPQPGHEHAEWRRLERLCITSPGDEEAQLPHDVGRRHPARNTHGKSVRRRTSQSIGEVLGPSQSGDASCAIISGAKINEKIRMRQSGPANTHEATVEVAAPKAVAGFSLACKRATRVGHQS